MRPLFSAAADRGRQVAKDFPDGEPGTFDLDQSGARAYRGLIRHR